MKYLNIVSLLLVGLISFSSACEKDYPNDQFPASEFISTGSYEGDYWPTEGWRYCAPREVGINEKKLKELNHEINLLLELQVDIHSITIVKDGYIVAEQYYSDEYKHSHLHPIFSCTKSLTSALTGIAIDQGYIGSEQDFMLDYFDEYSVEDLNGEKSQITLHHLLTMSAGMQWDELGYSYTDSRNTLRRMENSTDWVQFTLDLPIVHPPGSTYAYNTGASHLLSAIIQNSTGKRTDLFARENLFEPLGISDYYWLQDPQGIPYGGSRVRLAPRDMAKFGLLYLRDGLWENTRIIPEEWVQTSRQAHFQKESGGDMYYGYQFWVSSEGYYAAVGYGGQWIMIAPVYDLVVVFTNQFVEGDGLQWTTPERLLNTYILPAVED